MDERWLWDEVWRFIDVLRPRYFLLENVGEYLQQTKGKPLKELSKILPRAGAIDLNGKLYQQEQLVQHTLKRFFGVGTLGDTEHNGLLEPRTGKALENALYRGDKEKKSKESQQEIYERIQDNSILNTEASQATKPINKQLRQSSRRSTLEMDMEKNRTMKLNYGW